MILQVNAPLLFQQSAYGREILQTERYWFWFLQTHTESMYDGTRTLQTGWGLYKNKQCMSGMNTMMENWDLEMSEYDAIDNSTD